MLKNLKLNPRKKKVVNLFKLDDLYICSIKSNLCLYPHGKPYTSKILYFHDGNFIDPLNGHIFEYDSEYQDYFNISDDLYVFKIKKKLSNNKYIAEKFDSNLSKGDIEILSKILV